MCDPELLIPIDRVNILARVAQTLQPVEREKVSWSSFEPSLVQFDFSNIFETKPMLGIRADDRASNVVSLRLDIIKSFIPVDHQKAGYSLLLFFFPVKKSAANNISKQECVPGQCLKHQSCSIVFK